MHITNHNPKYTFILDANNTNFQEQLTTECPLCHKQLHTNAVRTDATMTLRSLETTALELIDTHLAGTECVYLHSATVHDQNDADTDSVTWIWAANGTLWRKTETEIEQYKMVHMRPIIAWLTQHITEHQNLLTMLKNWEKTAGQA